MISVGERRIPCLPCKDDCPYKRRNKGRTIRDNASLGEIEAEKVGLIVNHSITEYLIVGGHLHHERRLRGWRQRAGRKQPNNDSDRKFL